MYRKKIISFGIPCFNEELNIKRTYKALRNINAKNKKYNFEYIFVDNGSTDNTRKEIEKIARKNKNVKGIFLSRNFGPEASVQATIDKANGESMIIYDCDMQDPPELIQKFINDWEKGYDLVLGIRNKTEDSPVIQLARKAFYRILKFITNIEVPVDAGHFSLMDRKVIKAIRNLPEKYRFHRGLRAWVGYKTSFVNYKRKKRIYGKSAENVFSYFNYAFRSFFGFSYLPLDIIIYIGLLIFVLSFSSLFLYVLGIFLLNLDFNGSIAMILFLIFFSGIQIFVLSIIGKYIQVIFEETKNRPHYIIEKTVN